MKGQARDINKEVFGFEPNSLCLLDKLLIDKEQWKHNALGVEGMEGERSASNLIIFEV